MLGRGREGYTIITGLLQLKKDHAQKASKVLADAFFDDAFYRHVFPDIETRKKVLPLIYETITSLFVAKGMAYATSENMEGVMLVRGSGEGFDPGAFFRALKMLRVLRYVPLIKTIRRSMPFRAIWEGLDHFFKRYKGFIWLDMIAVDPGHRHGGHMGRMMRALLADVDAKQTFCMLETETPGNVPIYEHYGFRLIRAGEVQPQNVPFFYMVYDPMGIVKE